MRVQLIISIGTEKYVIDRTIKKNKYTLDLDVPKDIAVTGLNRVVQSAIAAIYEGEDVD